MIGQSRIDRISPFISEELERAACSVSAVRSRLTVTVWASRAARAVGGCGFV
jgi:hypothetical protein